MKDTITGRRCPGISPFPGALALYLRNRARDAEQALGTPTASPFAHLHVKALDDLAAYVEAIDPADQTLHALWQLAGMLGSDSDKFEPSQAQTELLARIGMGHGQNPPPGGALAELAVVALEDVTAIIRSRAQKLEELRRASEEAERLRAELAGTKETLASVRDELTGAMQAEADMRKQRDYLRDLVGLENADKPKPRRKAVEGHPGVYVRETPNGDVYEVTWTEDGRRRWKTIGPDPRPRWTPAASASTLSPNGYGFRRPQPRAAAGRPRLHRRAVRHRRQAPRRRTCSRRRSRTQPSRWPARATARRPASRSIPA